MKEIGGSPNNFHSVVLSLNYKFVSHCNKKQKSLRNRKTLSSDTIKLLLLDIDDKTDNDFNDCG